MCCFNRADLLDKVVFRVGILAALRSKCTRGDQCTHCYVNTMYNNSSYYIYCECTRGDQCTHCYVSTMYNNSSYYIMYCEWEFLGVGKN